MFTDPGFPSAAPNGPGPLSADMRRDLLAFYLERNEEVPLHEALGGFLTFVCRWARGVVGVSTAVALPDGWFALSSEGQLKRSASPPPEDFGRVADSECWARQLIQLPGKRSGWLAFWGQGNGQVPHLDLWRRMEEQLLARYALAEMQPRYQALIDAVSDAIITIDGQGLVIQFNAGASRLFGYSQEEILGQNVNLLMPPPHAQQHDAHIERHQRTGESRVLGTGRRLPARRQDGSIFPAHVSVSQFDQDGATHYIAILRDISDLVDARSRASVEERRHLSRELHDSVSQSLFGMALGAQSIKNSSPASDHILASADYILGLAEAGLAEVRGLIFELRPEAIESQGLLACLGKQVQALNKRYPVKVTFKGLQHEPHVELAVKHELYRILLEALHNVVKHAQARQCSVRFQQRSGEYQIIVQDDGCGFDVKAIAEESVGLRSMRERMLLLGGTIRINSFPGRGTTVKLSGPRHRSRHEMRGVQPVSRA